MGFPVPPGDPDALDAAIRSLGAAGTDVHGVEAKLKGGFAAALETWHGARSDDFRKASAGLQLQTSTVDSALATAAADLRGYAKLLRTNIDQINELSRRAERSKGSQGDAALAQQASVLYQAVTKAATATAGLIDAATGTVVPNATKLTPAQIARRVDTSTGVAGIRSAIADGTLTAAQAWGALASPSTEVPENAVNADGSVDTDVLTDDVNEAEKEQENPGKKALDTTLDYWTLATAPPGGWSVAMLATAAVRFSTAKSQLPVDLYQLTQKELDAIPKGPAADPLSVLDEIERGPTWSAADDNALSKLSALQRAESEIGGLGKFEKVGKVFDGLALVSDLWTLGDPKAPADDKVDAGLNLTGLALTTDAGAGLAGDALVASGLVAADASLGWIPVVGWALVAGTAAYEVYKHWDEVKKYAGKAWHATTNFVTNTAPHALSSAAHKVGHFISDLNPF